MMQFAPVSRLLLALPKRVSEGERGGFRKSFLGDCLVSRQAEMNSLAAHGTNKEFA